RFHHDFSEVRVHADSQAAESAASVNAHAYTVGRDIVFGSEQYAPETGGGRRLLAHELTHFIQQSGSSPAAEGDLRISAPAGRSEQEAEEAAERMGKAPQSGEAVAGAPALARDEIG